MRLTIVDPVKSGEEGEVVSYRQVVEEIRLIRNKGETLSRLGRAVAKVETSDGYTTGCGRDDAGQTAERSGLAGAIGAYQAKDLARFHAEREAVDAFDAVVRLYEVSDLDHRCPSPVCRDRVPDVQRRENGETKGSLVGWAAEVCAWGLSRHDTSSK